MSSFVVLIVIFDDFDNVVVLHSLYWVIRVATLLMPQPLCVNLLASVVTETQKLTEFEKLLADLDQFVNLIHL